MASSEEDLTFGNDLWHTGKEILVVREMAKFFTQMVKIQETYASSMLKLAKKTSPIKSTLSLGAGWASILEEVVNMANMHTDVAERWSKTVVDPLLSIVKDAESNRKQLIKDGKKLNADLQDSIDTLMKSKSDYYSKSKSAEVAQLTFSDSSKDPTLKKSYVSKLEKKAKKAAKEAAAADSTYQKRVKESNYIQHSWLTHKMPRVLNDYQQLEKVRIHMLRANFKKYCQINAALPEKIQASVDATSKLVEDINAVQDIQTYISENKTYANRPEPYEYEPWVEGTNDLKAKQQKWKRKMYKSSDNVSRSDSKGDLGEESKKAKQANVFAIPLEDVMSKQAAKFPALPVPRIMPEMIAALFEMDCVHQEGIFRVPGTAKDVSAMKIAIDDSNDYTIPSDNVHIPAAVLKLFFRSTIDPLIPVSLYHQAVAASVRVAACMLVMRNRKGEAEDAEPACAKIVAHKDVPEINQTIIAYLCSFLRAIALPEYAEVTKMNVDNLAMVFAPSILRCPSDDPTLMLTNADKEKQFVKNLITQLGTEFDARIAELKEHGRAAILRPPESPAISRARTSTTGSSGSTGSADDEGETSSAPGSPTASPAPSPAVGATPTDSPSAVSPAASPPSSPSPLASAESGESQEEPVHAQAAAEATDSDDDEELPPLPDAPPSDSESDSDSEAPPPPATGSPAGGGWAAARPSGN